MAFLDYLKMDTKKEPYYTTEVQQNFPHAWDQKYPLVKEVPVIIKYFHQKYQ